MLTKLASSFRHRSLAPARLIQSGVLMVAAIVLSGCMLGQTGFGGHYAGETSVQSQFCATDTCADNQVRGRAFRAVSAGEPVPEQVIDADQGKGVQFLLGYRISSDAKVQGDVPFVDGYSFQPSPSYTAELQAFAPAPAGTKWVGFQSATSFNQLPDAPIDAFVTLEAATEGAVLDDVQVGATGGLRYVQTGLRDPGYADPDSPIQCFADEERSTLTDGTNCGGVNQWDPTTMTPQALIEATEHVEAIANVTLSAAASDVATGTTGAASFTGTVVGVSFMNPVELNLAASTTIPGATVKTSGAVWTAQALGGTALPVAVTVPAGTPTGSYSVTLTATKPPAWEGDSTIVRTATATVRVAPPGANNGGNGGNGAIPKDTTGPVFAFKPKGQLVLSAGWTAAMPVACKEPAGTTCTGSLTLIAKLKVPGKKVRKAKKRPKFKSVVLGQTSFKVAGGKQQAVTVKLGKKGRAAFGKAKALPVTAALTIADGAGNKTVVNRKVTLKLPKPKKRAMKRAHR